MKFERKGKGKRGSVELHTYNTRLYIAQVNFPGGRYYSVRSPFSCFRAPHLPLPIKSQARRGESNSTYTNPLTRLAHIPNQGIALL